MMYFDLRSPLLLGLLAAAAQSVYGDLRGDRLIENELVAHLSPLSWEHIHLTGDYVWLRTSGSPRVVFGPFDAAARRHSRLSVLLFPFIEVTPHIKDTVGAGKC
jgi:hypothetical protein